MEQLHSLPRKEIRKSDLFDYHPQSGTSVAYNYAVQKKLHCEEYIEQVASKKLRKGVEDYNEMKFKPVEFDGFKRILKS